jgi:hypothetical protein
LTLVTAADLEELLSELMLVALDTPMAMEQSTARSATLRNDGFFIENSSAQTANTARHLTEVTIDAKYMRLYRG